MRESFEFLFSNLTQIRNLPTIYIIPFRFMNYKEESIPVDINTLKQLYAFIVTFFPLLSFLPCPLSLFILHCEISIEINTNAKVNVCGEQSLRSKTQACDSSNESKEQ